jgi:chromosome segregation ATPase
MRTTSRGSAPLTKAEFKRWAGEFKASFTGLEDRLDEHTRRLVSIEEKLDDHSQRLAAIEKTLDGHTTILDDIAKTLKDIRENTAAMLSLYRRLDHRTEEIATHVHLDLRKVDAAFHPPA